MLGHPLASGSYWTVRDIDTGLISVDTHSEIGSSNNWSRIISEIGILIHNEEDPRFGSGDFFDQSDKFMALRILDNEDELFGWVRMSHSFDDGHLVIHDWAWNSVPGEPILAGQIPEPRISALLAGLMTLGIVVWVRIGHRRVRMRLM